MAIERRIRPGLGTVQLGLPYGNQASAPLMPQEEAHLILREAVNHGIQFFDTAIGYGQSEQRIGDFDLRRQAPSCEISTKIPGVSKELWSSRSSYSRFLRESIRASQDKLRLERMDLLQFHQCDEQFLEAPQVQSAMAELLNENLCSSIGISVYTVAQAKSALAIPAVSALQVPVNLIDQRFIASDLLKLYTTRKIRVIARSLLLQGILVESASLPKVSKTPQLRELKQLLEATAGDIGIPLKQAALAFAFGNCQRLIDIGLLGVDSQHSLLENLALIQASLPPLDDSTIENFSNSIDFAQSQGLENPAHWTT